MTAARVVPPSTHPIQGSLVDLVDVGLTYPGGNTAVERVSLSIRRGEFVGVVGPSGCGKSSLLRLVSGLASPSHGRVNVATDHVGYVFQDPTLLPWRTVLSNVCLPAELAGRSRTDRVTHARNAIRLVGLTGYEDFLPRQLSGGMRMRVSLARALTMDPEVFLFDEPFGALDEISRERLGDELVQLFVTRAFAGLFITHSVAEAVYLSTRVVVMGAAPGTVLEEFAVPFGTDRDPEIRFTPEFAALVGDISRALRRGTPT